ncbi:hypothetical protein GH714_020603 [Hevea brasiliensis]|uniref:GH18 domain-containing protein n=1 Tax=Hevea brasiliensis TaxID=3981 RepID=A0A6A6KRP1_HEVBR|nr:hypothetical protein GH714_020603 [Hevea brasiliensis]
MLSIGGGSSSYSLSSDNEARSIADYLWNNFLSGSSNSRPLGDAILDGIDLTSRVVNATTLRWPPDYPSSVGEAGSPKSFKDSWNKWTSSITASKFFVGLPASQATAGSGYLRPNVLISQVLPFVKGSSKYGGIMLWNKYYDDKNGYSSKISSSV